MTGIEKLINEYLSSTFNEDSLEYQLDFYEKLKTLKQAIIYACNNGCFEINGKKHYSSHFNRRTKKTMKDIETELLKNIVDISKCKTFIKLYDLIYSLTKSILGAGKLTIYDIALRIGAFLKLYPTEVYLHAGALVGANKIGVYLEKGSKTVDKSIFVAIDPSFEKLDCKQIENFLCIYKNLL